MYIHKITLNLTRVSNIAAHVFEVFIHGVGAVGIQPPTQDPTVTDINRLREDIRNVNSNGLVVYHIVTRP